MDTIARARQIIATPTAFDLREVGRALQAVRQSNLDLSHKALLMKELHQIIIARTSARPKPAAKALPPESPAAIQFLPIGNGSLAIGGKPGTKTLLALKAEHGCNTVVTLLKVGEKGVAEIQQQVQALGMAWVWQPISASELPVKEEKIQKIKDCYQALQGRLEAGERVFIHCAAGIHRTGAFTFGLLLYMGHPEAEARARIGALRPVTLKNAVQKHWDWARQFYRPPKP